jgi:multicomponent Na+:H+ antiporter subunit G
MMVGILFLLGALFVTLGTLGIIRFRDVYLRLQGSGVSDNAGLGIILLALIGEGGFERHDLALFVLLLIMLFTNPIVTHSIAKSAFTQRHTGSEDGS